MTVKEQLKKEIDKLDEHYLELVFNIVRQFPHVPQKGHYEKQGEKIAAYLQKIADKGGLGIADPKAWQNEIHQDRPLPFRD